MSFLDQIPRAAHGCTAARFPVSHPVIHINPQLNKIFDLLHLVNTCKYCILYRWWEHLMHLAAHNSPHNFTHHVATPHRILWEMAGKPSSMGALVCHITILGLTGKNNMGHLTSWRFVNVYHHFVHYSSHNSSHFIPQLVNLFRNPNIYIYIYYIAYIYITLYHHKMTNEWYVSITPPLWPVYIVFIPILSEETSLLMARNSVPCLAHLVTISSPSCQLQPPQRMPCNACGAPGGDMQKCVPGCPEHDRCPQIVS